MPKIIFISGACGSGKSTFADALARHLVRQDHKTVYINLGRKPIDLQSMG
ncbi:MAG: adenylyl-sulfate kinase [Lachnospiraceae bacterium]|nr:adenylyl-sulfate kinase [Lachnospiraceae bacterium]